MIYQVLLAEYLKLQPALKKIYVVPLINRSNKKTDYLCRLYKDFIENDNTGKPEIESLSVFAHPRFFTGRLKGEKSLLHYHWFEAKDFKSFLGMFWKIFWIILYKISGGKIIWTIHNKYPHQKKYKFWNKNLRIFLARLSDKLHVHCSQAIEIMIPVLKTDEEKFFVIPHPGFESVSGSRDNARDMLNKKYLSGLLYKEDKLYLMFGAIARYKGIKEVMEVFNESDARETVKGRKKLLVAGFIKKGNRDYYRDLKKFVDERIFLLGNLIPDEDVPFFFNSADYVIFNYEDVLTSGAVHLALAYKKPVIIPFLGCLKELKGSGIYSFEVQGSRKNNLLRVLGDT
jgi:hypothetical protein